LGIIKLKCRKWSICKRQ